MAEDAIGSNLPSDEIMGVARELIAFKTKELLIESEQLCRRMNVSLLGHRIRMRKRWLIPIQNLRLLWFISTREAAKYSKRWAEEAEAQKNVKFLALKHLHGSALAVLYEVIVLLENGCPDGAMARWRKLHELRVVAIILNESDPIIAERYLNSRFIMECKQMRCVQQHARKLGIEPYSNEEVARIRQIRSRLIEEYHNEYLEDYGWAAPRFDGRSPDFLRMEAKAGLSHLRPYYMLANIDVHADSRNLSFRLGLPRKGGTIIQAGPSDAGLGIPGQLVAISMLDIDLAFFSCYTGQEKSNIESLIEWTATINVLNELSKTINEGFAHAENLRYGELEFKRLE